MNQTERQSAKRSEIRSKQTGGHKHKRGRRALAWLFMLAGLVLIAVVGAMVLEQVKMYRFSEQNRLELEALRTPASDLVDAILAKPDDNDDSEDRYVHRPASHSEDDDKLQAVTSIKGYPLDEETMANYKKILEQYPDFKGWIELPGWGISYPIFTDEENPLKYERMTRDGEFSYLGEVNYQGNPLRSNNMMVFGHTLTDGSGFSKIDKLPDQMDSISEEQRLIFIDLIETSERYAYRIASSVYFPREDTRWFRSDFDSSEEYQTWLGEVAGIHDYTGPIVSLFTCKNANGSIKTASFGIPIELG